MFQGGFDLEAAQYVCSVDRINAFDVFNLVSALVDKSLIIADVGGDVACRERSVERLRRRVGAVLHGVQRIGEQGEGALLGGRATTPEGRAVARDLDGEPDRAIAGGGGLGRYVAHAGSGQHDGCGDSVERLGIDPDQAVLERDAGHGRTFPELPSSGPELPSSRPSTRRLIRVFHSAGDSSPPTRSRWSRK